MTHRVALITTNQIDVGIRTLSGVLKAAGIDTCLVNLASREEYCPLAYPDSVKEQLAGILAGCTVVGISSVDMFFRRAQDLATWASERLKCRVLMGGMHPQLYCDEALSTPGVDAICVGEGLGTVVDLVESDDWDSLELGDFWIRRSDGSFYQGPMLPMVPVEIMDQLPLPDYTYHDYWLLDDWTESINLLRDSGGCFHVDQHQIGHDNSFVASFMWGCVNKCNFCNVTALSKKWSDACEGQRWYRIKPNTVVFDELREIKKHNPNLGFMCIMDNDFASRKPAAVREFFKFYKEEIGKPVYLMVSPNTLTEDKLKSMVEGGVTEINMGIESNEKTNRELYGRNISDDIVIEKARMINSYGDKIYPFYDLVIFNPHENEDTVMRTIDLVRRLPTPFDLVPHHLTLGSETLLYKKLTEEGSVLPRDMETITTSDYHDFEFEEYAGWPTLYLNLLLEWMGGRHDEMHYGRLPRHLYDTHQSTVLTNCLKEAGVLSRSTDMLDLLTSPEMIKYFKVQVDMLRRVHASIGRMVFSNQDSAGYVFHGGAHG